MSRAELRIYPEAQKKAVFYLDFPKECQGWPQEPSSHRGLRNKICMRRREVRRRSRDLLGAVSVSLTAITKYYTPSGFNNRN